MIDKIKIIVPKDIQFISQWKDYSFPQGHCVVDKGITGCGYTEFALRNNKNVILVSPRKLLLENKAEQHEEDQNVLYLKNEMKQADYNTVTAFYNGIAEHLVNCQSKQLPVKFMITNDSVHYLIEYLLKRNLLDEFYLIADEFQILFLDSFFKSQVENEFLESIQACKNIIYLSATPLQDEYLSELDEFKNLPFYCLDWSESPYVSKLMINRKHVGSLYTEACNVMKMYLDGNFPTIVTEDHKIVESTEAVFYFNSVNEITKLVKKFNLNEEQVNILCADTENNIALLKKIKHQRGKIPVKGEPNKMFTLCTSTVYVGSDFYSECASTYIFADPNLEHLALDISLDLPQIAGRQRNIDNPFKNIINLFYKTTRDENIIDEVSFRSLQNRRRENTLNLLNTYDRGNEGEKRALKDMVGESSYLSSFLSTSKTNGIVYNRLIEISNERAFRIQQKDYQDDISVTRVIRDSVPFLGNVKEYKDKFDHIIDDFLTKEFFIDGIFERKLKCFCLFMDQYGDIQYIKDQIRYKISDLRYHNYYLLFGTIRCKALKWKDSALSRELLNFSKTDELREAIGNEFIVGEKYTKKEIKLRLGDIFRVLKISSTPKATELSRFLEIKEVLIPDPLTKKRDKGFEILSKK